MNMQVTIHEAKTHLSKLIRKVLEGEEVIIARGKKPLVKLVVLEEKPKRRKLGGLEGIILHISDDFDEPLEDFKDYM
ncbi:MAG: type II toxin-antitoxin system Phd/YefM family antitoxin [Xanthomonadales bacterium]|jgi:prevent-host-death family protein|nr:type II toxin-antitoxin system Phd/YefM family antitoxin [Xanthomonadales bacterium]